MGQGFAHFPFMLKRLCRELCLKIAYQRVRLRFERLNRRLAFSTFAEMPRDQRGDIFREVSGRVVRKLSTVGMRYWAHIYVKRLSRIEWAKIRYMNAGAS